ncbi:DUF1971 domain-containing protein [Mixta tenebrionis]|uniref:DUF1971 domain-containing protein n=2 Tax=Mixta TaxID=2100764 RepID=A0A506V7I2_9GAMM|nr:MULTISPECIES: DUF1971 domain-containing protein [Mixta]QHM70028.1 putative S-adenosyl-L-methionine-dependent methyltransferase TehB [Mixta intestinalis]QHM76464.1 putative S-adenosyl-L-methionine-dependent methyltransferase TehB [Mixta theicola]TPW41422.1 DUF1971 domain-containing protein [Mixta tenebrionis]
MAHQIPKHFVHTRSTPFWDKTSVPRALLTHHNTKKGVYGRLSVMQGAVKYYGHPDEHDEKAEIEVVIEAGHFGISPPQYWHHIELLTDDTYFNIDFFADPEEQLEGKGMGQVVNARKGE